MIIDMNLVALIISELNQELHYKISESKPLAGQPEDYGFLIFVSNGEHVTIKFLGVEIWNSQILERFESPTVEQQIEWTERQQFEPHLRRLIQDELSALEKISML